MSQNLGGNLSPFSKVSCFPGCWMVQSVAERLIPLGLTLPLNCRLGMLLIEKTTLPEQLHCVLFLFFFFLKCVLSSSLASLCCNRYCTNDSLTFLWDIHEISLFADEETKRSFGVRPYIWHFLVPCFLSLIFSWCGAMWTCNCIPNCGGPKAYI